MISKLELHNKINEKHNLISNQKKNIKKIINFKISNKKNQILIFSFLIKVRIFKNNILVNQIIKKVKNQILILMIKF